MKKVLLIAVLMVSALTVKAQEYSQAIGLRGGAEFAGVTYKMYMGSNALDFTGNWRFGETYSSLSLQGLYEFNYDLADNLDWYWGLGAHVGVWGDNTNHGSLWLGVDGVVGLEYQIPVVPLAISLDYRPAFNVLPSTSAGFGDIGFGLKFCF